MKNLPNWKTTLAGVLVAVAAFVNYVWPQYAPFINTVIAVATGAGLIAAKDAGKQQEDTLE